MGRRDEGEFWEIARFLDKVKFKRAIFGVREADVYACMKELDGMYQDALEEIRSSQEQMGTSKENQIIRQEQELKETVRLLGSAKKKIQEKEEEIAKLKERAQTALSKQDEYQQKTDLLMESLTDTQKNKILVMEQAKRDAKAMVFEAQRQAEQLLAEGRAQLQKEQDEGRLLIQELDALRNKAEDDLKMIDFDLRELVDQVDDLQGRIRVIPPTVELPESEMSHIEEVRRAQPPKEAKTTVSKFSRYEAVK